MRNILNKLILRYIINCIKSAPQRQGNYVFKLSGDCRDMCVEGKHLLH
jgi:hypothetical protein